MIPYTSAFRVLTDGEQTEKRVKEGKEGTLLGLLREVWGEGNGNPLQYSCLENPTDRGAWWAAVYGVAESDTTEAT